MNKITVVVVEDHPLFRQGVVDALSLEADIEVVGQAGDGGEALEMIRQLEPDIAVLDVNIPGLNGQEVMRQIIAGRLPTRVVLLTGYDDPEQVFHAMQGGASAFVSKAVQPEKLAEILRQAAIGRYVVGEMVMDKEGLDGWLAAHTRPGVQVFGEQAEMHSPLSGRELEVLRGIAGGQSNKEIAGSLGISHQTVKNHVTAILRKLGVEDRTQAVLYALKRGWVRLDQPDSEVQEG
jgi:two-component system, NarL family, response regulator DegU